MSVTGYPSKSLLEGTSGRLYIGKINNFMKRNKKANGIKPSLLIFGKET
jgi:hypothetical protein